MSRARVITGADEHGRPIGHWADTEDAPPYGFMEPAFESTVESRQATPDELAAAVARETPHAYLAPTVVAAARATESLDRGWTPHDIAELKATTGAVTGADLVRAINEAGAPPETAEEGIMVDEPTTVVGNPSSDHSGPITTGSPLTTLSDAAAVAHQKLAAVRDAEQAWEIARAALAEAMAECFAVIGSPQVRDQPVPAPETVDEPREPSTVRQLGRHASHAGEATERDERAARVTEAVARHGGDRSAAAAELGMRPNAVAMVMKHADRRAEATA